MNAVIWKGKKVILCVGMSYAQKYHNLLSIGKIMQYEIDNHNMILNFDQIYDETESLVDS